MAGETKNPSTSRKKPRRRQSASAAFSGSSSDQGHDVPFHGAWNYHAAPPPSSGKFAGKQKPAQSLNATFTRHRFIQAACYLY